MTLDGKKIILTGGSGGMGSEVISALTAAGAQVAVVDKQESPGREQSERAAGPGLATFDVVDLTDEAGTRQKFDELIARMNGLDALIHTAGVHRAAAVEDVDDALWDFIFDVNVRGTKNANLAVFEALKANGGGSIVNFGSISGLRAEETSATYSASKGAVHSWTRSVAHAWGKHNIRVNAVLPIIATPMYRAAKEAMSDIERAAFERETEGGIPLGGAYGDAERDLAPVLVFLASDASRFITGQLLPVDGGLASVR